MKILFSVLSAAAGVYSVFIFIRVVMSWFPSAAAGRPFELLEKITDPYLNWWKNHLNIRIGTLDFSVVAAIIALSFAQTVFRMLAVTGRLTIGSMLSFFLVALWSVVSIIAGFCLVIIILRMIAYLTNRDTNSRFWGTVDSISQPVLYKFNRIIFGNRIGNFLKGMILSSLILTAVLIAGRIIIKILANFLMDLPI